MTDIPERLHLCGGGLPAPCARSRSTGKHRRTQGRSIGGFKGGREMIELVIDQRRRDLGGGFEVGRVLRHGYPNDKFDHTP